MIGLRCWFDFCQTSTWATMGMSHMSPPSGIPFPPPIIPIPLGGYRTLVWVPGTTQQIPIDYPFTNVSAYASTLLLIYCFESWVGKYGKASLLPPEEWILTVTDSSSLQPEEKLEPCEQRSGQICWRCMVLGLFTTGEWRHRFPQRLSSDRSSKSNQ